jgi:hypothetical protein
MVNDKRTSVHEIIASPLMQGIFDKWTWDGTGRFVFSLALTLGYGIYGQLKERYAVNKVYRVSQKMPTTTQLHLKMLRRQFYRTFYNLNEITIILIYRKSP